MVLQVQYRKKKNCDLISDFLGPVLSTNLHTCSPPIVLSYPPVNPGILMYGSTVRNTASNSTSEKCKRGPIYFSSISTLGPIWGLFYPLRVLANPLVGTAYVPLSAIKIKPWQST